MITLCAITFGHDETLVGKPPIFNEKLLNIKME
jgi:hypothetical protein